jgi:hypothetical protein
MWGKGGEIPEKYGSSFNLYIQSATEANPVFAGTPIKLVNTVDYGATVCADGDAIDGVTKATTYTKDQPVGCYLYEYARNAIFSVTGTVVRGDSVVADGKGGVKKATAPNGTRVVMVRSDGKVEVIL